MQNSNRPVDFATQFDIAGANYEVQLESELEFVSHLIPEFQTGSLRQSKLAFDLEAWNELGFQMEPIIGFLNPYAGCWCGSKLLE